MRAVMVGGCAPWPLVVWAIVGGLVGAAIVHVAVRWRRRHQRSRFVDELDNPRGLMSYAELCALLDHRTSPAVVLADGAVADIVDVGWDAALGPVLRGLQRESELA